MSVCEDSIRGEVVVVVDEIAEIDHRLTTLVRRSLETRFLFGVRDYVGEYLVAGSWSALVISEKEILVLERTCQ